METKQVASFIVRFQITDQTVKTNENSRRIKVTHVQDDDEYLFDSLEEAMEFMKEKVGDY
jgi:hypothetical protein